QNLHRGIAVGPTLVSGCFGVLWHCHLASSVWVLNGVLNGLAVREAEGSRPSIVYEFYGPAGQKLLKKRPKKMRQIQQDI
ncbi:unnamed protein product, partial [Cladocopium goreaui]